MKLGNLVAEYLFSEENKKKIVSELNKNINIPIIGEKTEEKIITAIYDTIEEVLKKVLFK